MDLRSLIVGLIMLPLALVTEAGAYSDIQTTDDRYFSNDDGQTGPMAVPWANDLPGVFSDSDGSFQVAQSADPQVRQLQEEIRALNGRIEELSFQILQMQEQMRKMQEDNEFRFQELEQKRSDNGDTQKRQADAASNNPPANKKPVETKTAEAEQAAGKTDPAAGAPKTLGSIRFDANGNVVGGSVASDLPQLSEPETDDTIVAALPSTDDPEELYSNSYQFILSGDYRTAEAGFREYINRFANTEKSADAHYWLGEALMGQRKYQQAAEVFLDANKKYRAARKGPDMLLKLGVSMAALNQRDVACATFVELGQRYPTASPALKQRLKREQASAGC